jgi:hypothetical protein
MPGATIVTCIVYEDACAVTPAASGSDANGPFASLYVTGGGQLELVTLVGTDTGLFNVASGSYVYIATKLVKSTSTATVLGLKAPVMYRVPLNPGPGGGPR